MEEPVNEVGAEMPQSLSPWEMIEAAAAQFDIPIKDPNPKCKKCYGRGYTAMRGNEPIACTCVHPEMNEATKAAYEDRQWIPRNRKERRAAEKLSRKNVKWRFKHVRGDFLVKKSFRGGLTGLFKGGRERAHLARLALTSTRSRPLAPTLTRSRPLAPR